MRKNVSSVDAKTIRYLVVQDTGQKTAAATKPPRLSTLVCKCHKA